MNAVGAEEWLNTHQGPVAEVAAADVAAGPAVAAITEPEDPFDPLGLNDELSFDLPPMPEFNQAWRAAVLAAASA